jgi:hypothetical protein
MLKRYENYTLICLLLFLTVKQIVKMIEFTSAAFLAFYNYNKNQNLTISLTVYLSFYARIIITIALIIDVFYLQAIYLFYKNI